MKPISDRSLDIIDETFMVSGLSFPPYTAEFSVVQMNSSHQAAELEIPPFQFAWIQKSMSLP